MEKLENIRFGGRRQIPDSPPPQKGASDPGADPGFFLGGGALVSCSTSTPINHIVFFFAEYQLY